MSKSFKINNDVLSRLDNLKSKKNNKLGSGDTIPIKLLNILGSKRCTENELCALMNCHIKTIRRQLNKIFDITWLNFYNENGKYFIEL